MELASYDQYEKMFGAGPMSSSMAMQNDDLARMFQQDKLKAQQAATGKAELGTMFDRDTYDSRVKGKQYETEKAGYEASDAGVANRTNTATEGLQLDAKQKEMVTKASKADLDQFEYGAQRMAYSQNPTERAEGQRLLQMHKDFVKLRETQTHAASEAAKNRSHAFALEGQRHKNATERAQSLAKLKLDAKGSSPEKLSSDQLRARYIAAAEKAKASGDFEAANALYAEAQYITQLRASERPDTAAGKPDVPAITGLPAVAPRAPVQPPGLTPQVPQPAQPPKATLSSVQQMYPGIPADKLKEAYKKKFGVDLQ